MVVLKSVKKNIKAKANCMKTMLVCSSEKYNELNNINSDELANSAIKYYTIS